jgi:hypothetical protein
MRIPKDMLKVKVSQKTIVNRIQELGEVESFTIK